MLVVCIGVPGISRCQERKENTKTMAKGLKEANEQLAEFEKTKEPNLLQSAVEAMEDLDFAALVKASSRSEARQQATRMWLEVLATIDRNLDPHFNPDDLPERGVIPPPSDDVQLPPGADPKAIKDPVARAEYEAALKANHEKHVQYRLQTKLRRLNPHATADVENFLPRYYTTSTADQEELAALLSASKLSTLRQQKLKALFERKGR